MFCFFWDLRLSQRCLPWFPFHGAQVAGLESGEDAEDFFDGATDGAGRDEGVFDDAGGVDDEESAVGAAVVFVEDTVVFGDAMGGVGQDWVGDFWKIFFKPVLVAPFAVGACSENFGVQCSKFCFVFLEAFDFCRTNKGEVTRVEKENSPASGKVFQTCFGELAFVKCGDVFEGWCGLVDGDHMGANE